MDMKMKRAVIWMLLKVFWWFMRFGIVGKRKEMDIGMMHKSHWNLNGKSEFCDILDLPIFSWILSLVGCVWGYDKGLSRLYGIFQRRNPFEKVPLRRCYYAMELSGTLWTRRETIGIDIEIDIQWLNVCMMRGSWLICVSLVYWWRNLLFLCALEKCSQNFTFFMTMAPSREITRTWLFQAS